MTSRNRTLRLIVMAIVIIGPILLLVVPPLLPHHTQFAVWPIDPASPTASRLDRVWTIVTYVGVAVVVLVGGLMFYAIMTFGHSGPIADDDEPPQIHGNSRLEITWTSIPIVIVAVLLAIAISTLQLNAPPRVLASNTVQVNIRGYQWGWAYTFPQLPGLSVAVGDLHLPVNRTIEWRVTSSDVVHDWWVPALDGHMDAYPNHIERDVIYTSRAGTYYAQCSKFCGLYHWKMHNNVIVEPAAGFTSWALANGAKRADIDKLVGGATGATAAAPVSHTSFASHLGVAFYIFHHDVYAPYQKGAFAVGATNRARSATVAASALGAAIHEMDQAIAAAESAGGTQRAPVASLASLRSIYQTDRGELAKDSINKMHLEDANSQTAQFESKASSSGFTIQEKGPSYNVATTSAA